MGGSISIPGECFDNVEPQEGFTVKTGEEYSLELSNKWEYNHDDCGHVAEENVRIRVKPPERPSLVVLKNE